ncbi:hypothetical protein ACLOJK_016542 [Asimina triloba]
MVITYVGVELAHEAGEVVVLEVPGKQIPGELRGTPDHERAPALVPRYQLVGAWIVHQLVKEKTVLSVLQKDKKSSEEFPAPAVETRNYSGSGSDPHHESRGASMTRFGSRGREARREGSDDMGAGVLKDGRFSPNGGRRKRRRVQEKDRIHALLEAPDRLRGKPSGRLSRSFFSTLSHPTALTRTRGAHP